MIKKVFINNKNQATFVCPECDRAKTVDVSQYAKYTKAIRVKAKCKCGHTFAVVLEKRKTYRKETNCPGVYSHFVSGKEVDKGRMTVMDVSRTGLKLKMNVDRNFETGEKLRVEFHLNDKNKSLIKKLVVVKNSDGPYVGVEFCSTDPCDQAIGFFMFS